MKKILLVFILLVMNITCVKAQNYQTISLSERQLAQDQQGLLEKKDFNSQYGDIDKQYLYYLLRYHKSDLYYYDYDLVSNYRKTGKIGVLGARLIGLTTNKSIVDLRDFEKETHGLVLRTISKQAFQTKKLKKVILPHTVTYVAPGAFGKAKVIKDQALQKQKDGSYSYFYKFNKKKVKERSIKDLYYTREYAKNLGGNQNYRHRYQIKMRVGQTISLQSKIKVGKKVYVMPHKNLVYKIENKAFVKIVNGKMKS